MNWKNLLKNLLRIAAVVAVVAYSAPILTTLGIAYAAFKGVDVIGFFADLISGYREGSGAKQRDKNQKEHNLKANRRFYDSLENQWNLHELPMDMFPSRIMDMGKAYFTVAGIPDAVYGEAGRHGRATFSFSLADERKAELVSNFIKENGLLGVSVTRDDTGRFVITADNAADICDIVKEFYPEKSMTVEREIRTTNQYRVGGCASFEEALAKFNANKASYSPAACVVSQVDKVDGFLQPEVKGSGGIDTSLLEVGEYVINETSVEVFSRNVSFNPGIDDTEEAMRSMAANEYTRLGIDREHDLVEDRCSVKPILSDALDGQIPSRCIMLDGNAVTLADPDKVLAASNVILKFDNIEEMLSVIRGELPLRDSIVHVDTDTVAARPGEFIVSLPVDAELMSAMRIQSDELDDALSKYKDCGLSRESLELSCITGRLLDNGYTSVLLADNPDFSSARVNGVPVVELLERMDGMTAKAEPLDDKPAVEQWLRDAAKIKSVNVELDLREQSMVVTSTVGDTGGYVTKVEKRKLDEDQVKALGRRGFASKAEMKDFLMMLHPDYFESYRSRYGTGPAFSNPVEAFINGERPKRIPTVNMAVNVQKKERQNAVRKNVNSLKM